VTNNNETTFEVVESDDKSIDSVEIEMISRLIKHENVRLLPSNGSEGNTRFLSSREKVHGPEGHVTSDTESTQVSTESLSCLFGVLAHHLLNSGKPEVKRVHVMLCEQTDSQSVVKESVTILQVEETVEGLDQSRFTSSIRSNEGNTSVQVNVHVDLIQDDLVVGVRVTNDGFIQTTQRRGDFLRVGEHEDDRRVLKYLLSHVNSVDGLDTRLH